MPTGEESNENKANKYVKRKGKKEQICKVNRDKEDLYTLKINCKGKRTIGKENKVINAEKI